MRDLLKAIAKRYGYEILGPSRSYASERSRAALLRHEKINLVLDVGANEGQFAGDMRSFGYGGRIISFEPLSDAHAQLLRRAQADPVWTVADRMAIGSAMGSVEIHIAGNSWSSSVLNMLPAHLALAPESAFVGTETVPMNRLDDICTVSETDRVLLKIDVQGYERQVLEGASATVRKCQAVICEMSLIPLYEGQPYAIEIWEMLMKCGFEPWSLEPGKRDPANGRMSQVDGYFVRSLM
jgi:FkbM family methyltransferase